MKYTTISFPSLGLELNPPSFFTLGSFNVHFYGVIIALGLVLAVVYAMRRRQQFGFSEDDILDGVLCIVPFAVLCARLYYCAFEWDMYKANPISILYIWEGGLAIYGGVIGAAIGLVVYTRFKKISLPALLDLVALGFLIGQAIGRWGNFMNREAFGAATETFLRMGLFNSHTGAFEYYHPTFLYESLWNVVGFLLLHFLSKKRQYDGQIALGYVVWYGLGRTFIEGLRMDSLMLGNFRVSQLLAAISCFAAATALILLTFKKHDPANLYVNVVAAREAELAAQAEAEAEELTEEAEETEEETVEETQEVTEEEPAEEPVEETQQPEA